MSPHGEDRTTDDDGKVLSPEELDIAEDNRVVELEDGRYVVSSDGSQPSVPTGGRRSEERGTKGDGSSGRDPEDTPGGDPDSDRPPESEGSVSRPGPGEVELTEETVRHWLREHVGGTDSQYGYHVTAKFDDATRQQHLVSNDVVTVFENLLMWYGQQLDSQTAVEEVLGILLLESNLTVQYPQQSLKAYLARQDLGPEDTIADLLETTEEGFVFPPSG
jgi:hypothetical protein